MNVVIVLTFYIFQLCSAQLSNDKNKLLNWCIKGSLHKESPGKEDLHNQCSPWSDKACCTTETTKNIHEGDMHNFNLNHCFSQTGKNLSSSCRRYFNLDNCFYECEPHIGLWVVETKRRFASERFLNVPLCASECMSWFEACKDDYTCAYNWPRNFKFKDGVNYCPKNFQCDTFERVFRNAKAFCENVYDHSWSVLPDSEPCMKFVFDPHHNPNADVAEYYIDKKFSGQNVNNANHNVNYVGILFFVWILCLIFV